MKNKKLVYFNFNKIFKKLLILIPIGVLINILFSLYTSDKIILSSLSNFSIGYFSLAIGLTLIPWITHALRLHIWVQFLGNRLSWNNIFKVVIGTDLGAAISPTAVGGAPVKIGLLVQNGFNLGVATSITTLGSIEDYIVILFAVPIALTISSSWDLPIITSIIHKIIHPTTFIVIGFILLLIITLVFIVKVRLKKDKKYCSIKFSLYQKIKFKMKIFFENFNLLFKLIYKKGKIRFLINLLLTTIHWICRYSVISALLASLGIPVNPVQFFVLQWLVFTLMTFIPTPGATFGAEATFYLTYKSFFTADIIGLITLGWRFLTFYFLLIVGVIIFILLNTPKTFLKKSTKRTYIQTIRVPVDQPADF